MINNRPNITAGLSSGNSEARFTINVKEGIVELEGKESFVDKHLEKFEEIFKAAVQEAIASGMSHNVALKAQPAQVVLAQQVQGMPSQELEQQKPAPAKHAPRTPAVILPIPVDLKASESKPGLREF